MLFLTMASNGIFFLLLLFRMIIIIIFALDFRASIYFVFVLCLFCFVLLCFCTNIYRAFTFVFMCLCFVVFFFVFKLIFSQWGLPSFYIIFKNVLFSTMYQVVVVVVCVGAQSNKVLLLL